MASFPARAQAQRLLEEAYGCNPGPWADHSRIAAMCAEKIAGAAGMDGDKAYVLGLLHDIGRKFGVKHLDHVYDGYHYMIDLGYEEAARICLTHSFVFPTLECYVGNRDISSEQQEELSGLLKMTPYDDYDRLIQLCDCLAGSTGVMDIEERMADVKRRYGFYPEDKWNANLALKDYFQEKTGKELYSLIANLKV